jgi:hypothetical protein
MKKYSGVMTGLLAMAAMGMSSGPFVSTGTERQSYMRRKSELTPPQKRERLKAKRARAARRHNRN